MKVSVCFADNEVVTWECTDYRFIVISDVGNPTWPMLLVETRKGCVNVPLTQVKWIAPPEVGMDKREFLGR